MTSLVEIAEQRGLRVRRDTARLDDSGWDFVVVHVDGIDGRPWILRAPRRPETASAVRPERRLLALVCERLTVSVPDWRVADETLIAYPRLAGQPAAEENPVTFELHWRIDRQRPPQPYITALGLSMAQLHTIEVTAAAATGIPVREPDAVRGRFAGHLNFGVSELGMHTSWWQRGRRWLEDDRLWSPRVVLIHGDLHPGHTLVDKDGALTGILDWTDAEIGNPGQEFVEAARKFPPHVLDELIEAYVAHGGPVWSGLRDHVVEAIAFAPLTLAVLGAEAGQQRYVDKARALFCVPVPT